MDPQSVHHLPTPFLLPPALLGSSSALLDLLECHSENVEITINAFQSLISFVSKTCLHVWFGFQLFKTCKHVHFRFQQVPCSCSVLSKPVCKYRAKNRNTGIILYCINMCKSILHSSEACLILRPRDKPCAARCLGCMAANLLSKACWIWSKQSAQRTSHRFYPIISHFFPQSLPTLSLEEDDKGEGGEGGKGCGTRDELENDGKRLLDHLRFVSCKVKNYGGTSWATNLQTFFLKTDQKGATYVL